MGPFEKLNARIEVFEKWCGLASGIAIAIIMVIAVFSVVMRYILRSPALWTLEISEYLLVAAIFLALGYVLQEEGHVSVDLLLDHLPGKARLALDGIVASAVMILFSGLLCYAGIDLAVTYRNLLSDSVYRLPLFPSYAMIPIGSFILFLQAVIRLIKKVNLLKAHVDPEDSSVK